MLNSFPLLLLTLRFKGQRSQQTYSNTGRHRVHHDHGPEGGQIHARSREQTDQRHDGVEKRDDQGDQCQNAVEPQRAASKATDQDKGNQCQQQKDDGTANDKGRLQEGSCVKEST